MKETARARLMYDAIEYAGAAKGIVEELADTPVSVFNGPTDEFGPDEMLAYVPTMTQALSKAADRHRSRIAACATWRPAAIHGEARAWMSGSVHRRPVAER